MQTCSRCEKEPALHQQPHASLAHFLSIRSKTQTVPERWEDLLRTRVALQGVRAFAFEISLAGPSAAARTGALLEKRV
jgi:hypothetical protein